MYRHLITFITFVISLILFKEANAQQPNAKVPAGLTKMTTVEGISEYQLTNGLRILLAPDNSLDSITVNVVYLVGSRDEGYGESGMAHLLEHLLFKGTEQFSDIKNEFTKRGARWNGTTSYDRTNYFETFTASADNLDWALRLEADRMVNSRVAKSDLDSEMTVVRNEFEAGENSPFSVLADRMTSAAYSWHNYGRSIIGSRSDIENVPIERLQAFYRHYYQPDNAVLVVAGKFEEAEALKMVARHFGPLPRPTRKLQKTYTAEPTQDGERMVKLRRVGDTQIAATLYHIPSGAHPEYAAIDLLVTILREVPGGRLHKALVESKHATSILGFERQLREAGYAFFGANLRPDMSLDTARDDLINTIESLAAHPITAEELERARTRLLNEIEQLLADTRKFSITLTEYIAMGDWRLLFLHRDRIKQVTLDEVQHAANNYFKPSNRTLGLFIPTSTLDRAEIPAVPDVALMLEGYRGDPSVSAGEAFDPTPTNIEARIVRATLPGGMKLAMLPKKTRGGTVVASLLLHWGDEESTQNRATACDITSAMLMRGTKHHTRQTLRDTFDRLKAQVDVNNEGVSIETVRANLPDTLRLVAEVLREPTFPEKEFEQLKLAMLSSIESKRSEPGAQASLLMERHLAPYPASHWHYTPTLEERIERINGLTLAEVKQCHSELFGASDSEFSIIGDFEPEEILQLTRQLFGDWKSPRPYQRIPVPYQDITPINHDLETPDKANAVFQAGMNLRLRDDHPDYPALIVGNYLLGGSADSRLWRRIREQEGLSYNVASTLSASTFDEQGEFNIYAIYAPENRARVESAVKEELERVMKEGFTTEEVETAKAGYLQARRIARGQDKALAERLANYLTRKRTMQWDIEFETRIAALTPESILAALRKHLDFNKLTIIKAGDFSKVTTATASQ
ncbi:pitrilysin family protein [Nitrosomonas sp. Nm33]|uniref:M16 family metallopeptidase n=1 Tax=Nitrosomonas sp. Nm33 TaxID=133724 RepID=UPI00089D4DA1|nr:pitrilysin family protein [Nitrosomonas sp. Nm33]SDY53672.1 zinc protease [Nitrosomonas sp. Nm33]